MKHWYVIVSLAALTSFGVFLLDSCKKTPVNTLPAVRNLQVPPGFPQPVYSFAGNPLTDEGFLLGRKLFYDGRLSIDGNFPCSSCHQPVAAFTTFEHDRSHGYNHSHTLRNAPGLFNLAWNPSIYLQDGGARTLEEIYRNHITSPTEMAETIPHVISKLQDDATYRAMFRAAFGNEEVTSEKIYKALTQFLMNLVSADSRYDKIVAGKASFTSQEAQGFQLFQSKCAACHQPPLFTDYSFHNVGLPVNSALNDFGRMRVTQNPADSLKFRTPSLRNADLTSYYFHDGRFSFPVHVLEHYRSGVQQSATLDPLLSNGISMTDAERNAIVSFISTLTDSAFLNNPRFRE